MIDEFAPAWKVLDFVEHRCKKTFMVDHVVDNEDGTFTTFVYADYIDPRWLIPKFEAAGATVRSISHEGWNWYKYTFEVTK